MSQLLHWGTDHAYVILNLQLKEAIKYAVIPESSHLLPPPLPHTRACLENSIRISFCALPIYYHSALHSPYLLPLPAAPTPSTCCHSPAPTPLLLPLPYLLSLPCSDTPTCCHSPAAPTLLPAATPPTCCHSPAPTPLPATTPLLPLPPKTFPSCYSLHHHLYYVH